MSNVRDEEVPPYLVPLNDEGTEVLSFVPRERTGWAAYFPDGNPGRRPAMILLRFGARNCADDGTDIAIEDAPIEIREMRVHAGQGVDLGSAVLRRIPFDRIEAAVNQPRHRKVLTQFVKHWRVVADGVPDVRTPEHPTGHLSWMLTPLAPEPNPRPELELPVDINPRNRPDAFYATVAEAFLWLASVSPRPAQDLAEANSVPVTTVHRWVREAKARGLLLLPTKGDFA